jgi:cell division transport system permease protein
MSEPVLGRLSALHSAGESARMLPQTRLVGPMPWVIAIMVALTVMAMAAGLALSNVVSSAQTEISGGLTVQIIEGAPAAREQQVAAALRFFSTRSDVAAIKRVSDAELAQLLEPWLGGPVDEEDALVTPALIDVQLTGAVTAERLRTMRAELARVAPRARIEAQANWLAPVFDALRSMQLLAIGLVVLLAAITTAAVWLAARSALGSNQDTIEVIHHLGGTDGQIAGIFQRSIAIDAAVGGFAGLMLGLSAIFVLGRQFAALGSGLVAGGGLAAGDWLTIVAVPVAAMVLAVLTARLTVLAALRRIL